MFRGINTINLDAKGRMAMPARYRERLLSDFAGQLVVTIDPDNACLLIYTKPEWETIEHSIKALPSSDRAAERLKQLLVGYATDIDLDGNGRILLPQELREYAKLAKHVSLVGQINKFRIWDQQAWIDKRKELLDEKVPVAEMSEQTKNLSY